MPPAIQFQVFYLNVKKDPQAKIFIIKCTGSLLQILKWVRTEDSF